MKSEHLNKHRISKRRRAIVDLHGKFGVELFSYDPYVKFLPLMLCPPILDWNLVRSCAKRSNYRFVIPVYGRDAIALEGWKRFACIAAYSLLCCKGIENYAVDILICDKYQENEALNPDLLFENCIIDLQRLEDFSVCVMYKFDAFFAADLYRYYTPNSDIIIRMDADSGLLPGTIEKGLFTFKANMGHSGLNFKHTGRNGLEQLMHPEDGRMTQWPKDLQRNADEFLELAASASCLVLKKEMTPKRLSEAVKARPWPSEGVSYMRTSLIPSYIDLRAALLEKCVIPEWDEEIVKLLLSSITEIKMEMARVPVFEYSQMETYSGESACVNFRNIRRVGPHLENILKSEMESEKRLGYLRNFVNVIKRIKAREADT